MKELLEGLIAETPTAIKNVYQIGYHHCKWAVLNQNGTDTDAKDVFQQAVFSLLERVRQPDFEINNLKAYLFQSCRYIWLKEKRERRSTELVEHFSTDIPDTNELEQKEVREERLDALYKALDQLEENCRVLLELTYFEKQRDKDIAVTMKYQLNFVRVKRKRCLDHLRKLTI